MKIKKEAPYGDRYDININDINLGNAIRRSATMIAVFALSITLVICQHMSVQAAPTEITGNVFADYNADGVYAGVTEHGIAGIQVQAFDADNNPIGVSVATDAAGNYTIPGLQPGQQVRLEFTIPSAMGYLQPGAQGADSATTVIFATENGENVDLGLNNPADFCQSNPDTAVTCFVIGEYNDSDNGEAPTLVSIPYEAEGDEQNSTTKLSIHEQIGTVFGLAYQRNSESLYGAAYLKRFADFGPGGPDAVYQLGTTIGVSGTVAVSGTINLSALAGGTNVAGIDPHDFTELPGEDDFRDEASYGLVGKMGLGDVEISDDMNTLYVVNMADRQIYVIDISSGDAAQATLITTIDTPDECGAIEHRPMGLAWHFGKLWVGSVCEDSSNAYVHSIDPASSASALEVTVDLSYTREQVLNTNGSTTYPATWNPWSDALTDFEYTLNVGSVREIAFPQPMLSDIDFDGPNMILGIRDRFGDQAGYTALQVPVSQNTAEKPSNGLYSGDAAGDILRVCSVDGAFVVETAAGDGCSPTVPDLNGPTPNSGVGGPEYYHWDAFPNDRENNWTPTTNIEHYETSQGGLLQLPGSAHILQTAMDPFVAFSAGYLRLDNLTGQRVGISPTGMVTNTDQLVPGGYTIYKSSDNSNNNSFGKANGLGDIEALCQLAPLEIGNRVWADTDGDGIQDPGEDGIDGVTVELYQNGTLVGTATTANGGEYYFGGINNQNMAGNGALLPDTDYEIRISLSDPNLPPSYSPTSQDYNGNADNGDLHDSDGDNGILNPGFTTVAFTTGGAGANSHLYDFGFGPVYDLALIKTLADGQAAEVTEGASVNYVITVKNQGTVPSGVFTVTDQIPGGMSYVSSTGTDWVCNATAGATDAISCDFNDTLAPDETTDLALVLQVDDATLSPFWNWAEISANSSAAFNLTDQDSTPDTNTGIDAGVGTGLSPNDPVNNTNDIDYDANDDEDDNDFEPITAALALGPSIQLEKTVYLGQQGIGGCPGQELVTAPQGSAITYCFVVTNTGDTYLNNIAINDLDLDITQVDMVPGSGQQPLAPDESLTFLYETTLDSSLINTADTIGTPSDAAGNEIPNLSQPTDEDDAAVSIEEILAPAINIEKTVYVGHDAGAGCVGAELVSTDVGAQITYCFEITNTGDTWLDEIALTDATLGINRANTTQLRGSEPLSTTESLVLYFETTATATLTNTASTEGNPVNADGSDILNLTNPTDQDTAAVQVPGPGISLSKTVYDGHSNGAGCAGTELVMLPAGSEITYCFIITNSGDTYLNDITLNDGELGISRANMTPLDGTEPLAPGATMSFFYETTLQQNLINTASASGTPSEPDGTPLVGITPPIDDDIAEVRLPAATPDIQLDKTVYLGHDRGTMCRGDDLVEGSIGSEITYCFVVENKGDTYLDNIQIQDPALNIDQDDMNLLIGGSRIPPGTSIVYYYETTLDATIINTANTSASPTDADGNAIPGLDQVTDEDDAEVRIVLAAIGDYVWLDENANGIQDSNELGLPGIAVTLYDDNDQAIRTTTTDNLGLYMFDNLTPGIYSLGFDLPSANYAFSPQNVVAPGDNISSDVDPSTGRTEQTTLSTAEIDMTWDAGIYGKPELSISKEANLSKVEQNGRLVYTIRYQNTGIGQANNVVVTESVPMYTKFVPQESSGFICANNSVEPGTLCTFNVGIVPATVEVFELTFVVQTDMVIPQDVTLIENVVSISDSSPGGVNVDGAMVEISRPLAGELIEEPETTFVPRLYLPVIR